MAIQVRIDKFLAESLSKLSKIFNDFWQNYALNLLRFVELLQKCYA